MNDIRKSIAERFEQALEVHHENYLRDFESGKIHKLQKSAEGATRKKFKKELIQKK